MGQAAWYPDWYGNNGRTIISPLFETNCVLNTTNYGCFSSKTLDTTIEAGRDRDERQPGPPAVDQGRPRGDEQRGHRAAAQ